MKTSTLLVATFLGLAIATTQAQTQTSTTTTTTNYVQTSKIVGMKVRDSGGQEIGVVKDVVLDRNSGCMAYTVLSTGGTSTRTTGGAKTVAVPWTVYTTTNDPSIMTVRVERDRIYNAPAFDYARIDEYSTPNYINNVYSYYGVQPGVGIGVGVSGATSTTTGTYGTQSNVSGQTTGTSSAASTAASPAATAMTSPAATATASPAATAKASPASTAGASRRASASPSATTGESTGERGTHRHRESGATASPGTSSSSESATSDEGTTERKAGRHHKTTEEESASETGASKKRERSRESEAEPTATP